MVRPIHFIKLLLIFLLASHPVQADEPLIPIDFSGHYDFAFSGVPLGKLDLRFTQSATKYTATADVKTVGLARVFVQHESHTISKGWGSDFHYPQVDYESRYSTRGKPKSAKISKKDGVIFADVVNPPDNRAIRPAVPLEQKSAAFDPLAVGLAIRSEFARAQKDGRTDFTLDYYDGRRLTRVYFTVGKERVIRIKGQKYPVFTLTARRELLAGHTDKERARIDPHEPSATLYFSRDAKFMPIYLEVPVLFGIASATLRM
ncbi:MAG: DUF3108 domain-containing protein [Alphaproteobacteria bacterium]|nr:DUF3108 domain-containing protein [Alphaproteobacteria bacterium]